MLSILEPSLDDLMKKVDSKYALVVAAAKRGRQITEARERVVDGSLPKPVSLALDEIARGVLEINVPESPRDLSPDGPAAGFGGGPAVTFGGPDDGPDDGPNDGPADGLSGVPEQSAGLAG